MIVKTFFGRPSSNYLRTLSISVFSAYAILLCALYFIYTAYQDGNNEFHSQFVDCADKITENFNNRLHFNLLALDAFSISSTSYALDTNNSWPMITLPDFAIRSWTTRQEIQATTLGLLPIVTADKRQQWESYVLENHDWIDAARQWEEKKGGRSLSAQTLENENPIIWNRILQKADFVDGISGNIYTVNMEGEAVVDGGIGPFSPLWMTSPAPRDSMMINFNMLSHHLFWRAIEDCMYSRFSVLSRVFNFESNGNIGENVGDSPSQIMEEPISSIFYPVFQNFQEDSDVVAVLAAEINWRNLFEKSLPDRSSEVICVVENACNQKFSFKIDGHETTFLGHGDHHDPKFSNLVQTRGPKELIEKTEDFTGSPLDLGHCPFLIHFYPVSAMKETQTSFGTIPLASSLFLMLIFCTVLLFYINNHSTSIEEKDVENRESRSVLKEPVSGNVLRTVPKLWKKGKFISRTVPKHLKDVIRTIPDGSALLSNTEKNILTNATVMVAGICSLEKWRKEKEPHETDQLLDTVQRTLSVVAKRHGISHVERIDDNILAIFGSDDSDVDHAAIVVYFACECRRKISEVLKSIPANELSVRFGIHSGNMKPLITSIDNGSNRFELFGDIVVIANQMLEDGKENRIHVSVDTAELLNLAGKSDWVSPRSDSIYVKGIGSMSTFWVKPKACLSTVMTIRAPMAERNDEVSTGGTGIEDLLNISDTSKKNFDGLVDQNTGILLRYLRAIYAKRLVTRHRRQKFMPSLWDGDLEIGGSIIEEARETVQAAPFDFKNSLTSVDPQLIEISDVVKSQLRVYVTSIGAAYRRVNSFHNFQHASHTVLSIDQMIKRMTCSSDILQTGFDGTPRTPVDIAEELDKKTFSINSDPIIQFAMVLSALIHGVDHMGVSNQQLIKNGSPLATLYKKRCVSQQNALDISWWLLMTEDYDDLRAAIYSDTSEKRRFRQVLVNSVIATDILDSKMRKYRDNNWNKAFIENPKSNRRIYMDPQEKRNLQVTSIIESIMQVAVSSYRVQSYRTYAKWNERLFEEVIKSNHDADSLGTNPVTDWYESELNHFENFLIPLLSRLKDTGVFGGSGQIFLKQASDNLKEWKSGGKVMVEDMVDRISRRIVAVQEDTIHFT